MKTWQSSLFTGFRALRRVSIVSSVEDGALLVVLPVLAQQVAGNTGVAVVFVATTAPWAIASLPIGYLADRFPRSRLAIHSAYLRAAAAIVLAVASTVSQLNVTVLASAAFVLASCGVASEVFRQSLVPDLVRAPDRLLAANAEIARLGQLFGGFVGPLIGGSLMLLTPEIATISLALFAIFTLIITHSLPLSSMPTGTTTERRSLSRELFAGLEQIATNKTLRTLGSLSFAVSLIWFTWETAFTAYVLSPTGLGASSLTYSLLLLATATGALIGSELVESITKRFSLKRTLVSTLLAWVVWFTAPTMTESVLAIAAALVLGGGAGLMWATISITARQMLTESHLLGRTTAAYRMLTRTGRSLGAAMAGVLMTSQSWATIFLGCATAIALVALVIALAYKDQSMLARGAQ